MKLISLFVLALLASFSSFASDKVPNDVQESRLARVAAIEVHMKKSCRTTSEKKETADTLTSLRKFATGEEITDPIFADQKMRNACDVEQSQQKTAKK